MLYETQTPQFRLHEEIVSNLNRLAQRYVGYVKQEPHDGVTDDHLELLNRAAPAKLLADYWDWQNGESVTAALIRAGEELPSGLTEWASALRSCVEAELFPDTRAGVETRNWLLGSLVKAEHAIEQLTESVALLDTTHLLLESHYLSALEEIHRLEAFNLREVSDSDPVAVFTLAIDRLYAPLQVAWERYFTPASRNSLQEYVVIAEKLHSESSPLVSLGFNRNLQPRPDEISKTEFLLNRLIAVEFGSVLD